MFFFDVTTVRSWTGQPTGIPRVVTEISREVLGMDPAASLIRKCPERPGFCAADPGLGVHGQEDSEIGLIDPGPEDWLILMGSGWNHDDHNEELAALKNQSHCRLAFMIHDLIPLKLPQTYGEGFSSRYEQWLRQVCDMADLLFVNSQSTARDLAEFMQGMRSVPIEVLRLGDPEVRDSAAVRPEIASLKNFCLCVSTLELRKNHQLLINIWRYLAMERPSTVPDLVLVGRLGWMGGYIDYQVRNDPLLRDRCHLLYEVDETELAYLYRNCMFTLYPSWYEGWGLPLAESLAHGKVCIASSTSSMSEIAQGLAVHLSPYRSGEWIDQIDEFLDYPERLAQKEEQIRKGYRLSTWKDCADQVLRALRGERN